TSTRARETADGPTPRRLSPWLEGSATRLEERRKVPTAGTLRSTSSRSGDADCSRSVRSSTVTSAGTSRRRRGARLAVTTVSPTRGPSGRPAPPPPPPRPPPPPPPPTPPPPP